MKEQYTQVLIKYIPETSVPLIVNWIIEYGVHLKITKDRSTKLGDFRPTIGVNRGHRITVNYNLNKYAFLITLVHEIAHFDTWNTYRQSVKPHGVEWKNAFKKLMSPFLREDVFPVEVLNRVVAYMNNPAASSCVDEDLFKLKTGRVFKKGKQRRKYFRCEEFGSGKHYLINPLAEVEPISEESL